MRLTAALALALFQLSGSAEPAKVPEGALLTLRRTGCYGTCPDYTLTVYEDGRTRFVGKLYVHDMGERLGSMSAREVAELRGLLDQIHFADLPERYDRYATDLPSTLLCRGGERPHCVLYEAGQPDAPQALFDLTARIDALAKSQLWIKGPLAKEKPADHPRDLGHRQN